MEAYIQKNGILGQTRDSKGGLGRLLMVGRWKVVKKKKAFQTHDNKKPPNKVKIWYFHEVPRSNENITLMKQVLKRERDLAKHSGRKMGGENKAFCKKKSGKTLLTMSWGQTDLQSQNPLQIY